MADNDNSTCFYLSNLTSSGSSAVLVLGRPQAENASRVLVAVRGANLYCGLFDASCLNLGMQVFTRFYEDSTVKPACTPICGNDVMCVYEKMNKSKSRCVFKCVCPPSGCKEYILVFNSILGTIDNSMKICSIVIRDYDQTV